MSLPDGRWFVLRQGIDGTLPRDEGTPDREFETTHILSFGTDFGITVMVLNLVLYEVIILHSDSY